MKLRKPTCKSYCDHIKTRYITTILDAARVVEDFFDDYTPEKLDVFELRCIYLGITE